MYPNVTLGQVDVADSRHLPRFPASESTVPQPGPTVGRRRFGSPRRQRSTPLLRPCGPISPLRRGTAGDEPGSPCPVGSAHVLPPPGPSPAEVVGALCTPSAGRSPRYVSSSRAALARPGRLRRQLPACARRGRRLRRGPKLEQRRCRAANEPGVQPIGERDGLELAVLDPSGLHAARF